MLLYRFKRTYYNLRIKIFHKFFCFFAIGSRLRGDSHFIKGVAIICIGAGAYNSIRFVETFFPNKQYLLSVIKLPSTADS